MTERLFSNTREGAKAYARRQIETNGAVVVKPDGLTAGKGVVIAKTIEEAEQAIDNIFDEVCK